MLEVLYFAVTIPTTSECVVPVCLLTTGVLYHTFHSSGRHPLLGLTGTSHNKPDTTHDTICCALTAAGNLKLTRRMCTLFTGFCTLVGKLRLSAIYIPKHVLTTRLVRGARSTTSPSLSSIKRPPNSNMDVNVAFPECLAYVSYARQPLVSSQLRVRRKTEINVIQYS